MAANDYAHLGLNLRWAVGEPTAADLMNISRIHTDVNRWTLKELIVDPDNTPFALQNVGAATFAGNLTVGVNGTGHDVKFFGDTDDAYMLWDESADDLKLVGAAGLTVDGNVDIDGTLEADAYTVNGTTLNEYIADTVGDMVGGSGVESGISVAYDDGDNTLDFTVGTLNQDTTGNAATATALASARTIGGTSFDGTANIAVGLAATATILATARTIGGVSFDGSANINLPGVNTAGNQATSGLAATATVAALATTVTITDNESTNESNAIIFTSGGDVDGGNIGLESDGTLTYNPSTGYITATGFVGALNGNASTASTAALATTVTITDNENTNEWNALIFTSGGDVDGGNMGLESDGDLTYNPLTSKMALSGELTAGALDISGDVDIDGTTNLDIVDIDGAVHMASTLNVATATNFQLGGVAFTGTMGLLNTVTATLTDDSMADLLHRHSELSASDGTPDKVVSVNAAGALTVGASNDGYDVKFFGNATGAYMLWDESTDDLILAGPARLGIGGSPLYHFHSILTGTAIQTNLVIDNAQAAAADVGSAIVFVGHTEGQNMATIQTSWIAGANTNARLQFRTRQSGTETTTMTLDENGFVGIGTDSPDALLNIESATTEKVIISDSSGTGSLGLGLGYDDAGSTSAYLYNRFPNANSAIHLGFGTTMGSSVLMSLVSKGSGVGFVGIGKSPGYTLDVLSATAADFAALIRNSHSTNGNGLLINAADSSATFALRVMDHDGTTDFLTVRGSGLVGIGAAVPNAHLHIKRGGDAVFPAIHLEKTSYMNHYIGYDTAENFIIGENVDMVSTVRLAIDTGGNVVIPGNVGIGGSATTTLHLSAAIPKLRITDTDATTGYMDIRGAGPEFYFDLDPNSAVATSNIHFATDGTTKLTILSSGNVGINDPSPDGLFQIKSTGDSSTPFNVRHSGDSYTLMDIEQRSDGEAWLRMWTNTGPVETIRLATDGDSFFMGDVGIGEDEPAYPLHVKGTVDIMAVRGTTNAFYRAYAKDGGAAVTSDFSFGADDGPGAGSFILYDRIKSKYRMVINTDGNLGIGVVPTQILDIGDGAAATTRQLKFTGGTDAGKGAQMAFFRGGTPSFYLTDLPAIEGSGNTADAVLTTANGIRLRTNWVDRLIISSDGDVGIGHADPDEVAGSSRSLMLESPSGYAQVYLGPANSSAGSPMGIFGVNEGSASFASMRLYRQDSGGSGGQIQFWTKNYAGSDSVKMTIAADGAIAIGQTLTTTAMLKINTTNDDVTKHGLFVEGMQTSGHTAYIYSNSTQTGHTLHVNHDGGGAGAVVHIENDGTGNALEIQDGGTINFVVADGGNVGIGVAAPSTALIGATAPFLQIGGSSVPALGLKNNVTAHEATFAVDGNGLYIESGKHATAAAHNFIKFRTAEANNGGASTRMTIDYVGFVGIGTDDPSNKLTIYQASGSADGDHALRWENAAGTLGYLGAAAAYNSGELILYINGAKGTVVSGNGNSYFNGAGVDGGGNVGIGTAAPVEELHLHKAASTNCTLRITNAATGATVNDGLALTVDGNGQPNLVNLENTDFSIQTNANWGQLTLTSDNEVHFRSDAGHDHTDITDEDTYLHIEELDSDGGAHLMGVSDSAWPLSIHGLAETPNAISTSGSIGVVEIKASKTNGAQGWAYPASGDNIFSISLGAALYQTKFLIKGDGTIYASDTTMEELDDIPDAIAGRAYTTEMALRQGRGGIMRGMQITNPALVQRMEDAGIVTHAELPGEGTIPGHRFLDIQKSIKFSWDMGFQNFQWMAEIAKVLTDKQRSKLPLQMRDAFTMLEEKF